ncbi:MAG TPA: DUF4249 domain-containing protein [Mucilaginibacter sp.]|jgi:hypothetical protein|nr:DUF4249 domain-containing protein [Mucilaginibacter sp.]
MKNLNQLLVLIILLTYGCRQSFLPPIIATNSNYLVVEGIINSSGTDSTFIKLARTVPLNNITSLKVETGAQLSVESDANINYPLKELKTAGTYACAPLNLNKAGKYRLRIITTDHRTYLSDFVPVKEVPAIDSLGYSIKPNGLQLYVNAHDAANATRYYRWDYTETWEFHAKYYSTFIASNNTIIPRPFTQNVFYCWANLQSSDIVVASTNKLAQDVLYQSVITTVPSGSEKLSMGYSILVKQYAITEDAFNFWQNLRKNTEELGSIFDAQPSTINGNIHNINDNKEAVFGYISAGTTVQKRITVLNGVLPSSWGQDDPYPKCGQDTIYPADYASTFYGKPPAQLITIPAINPNHIMVGYLGSGAYCADCTVRGSVKKPAYWPN